MQQIQEILNSAEKQLWVSLFLLALTAVIGLHSSPAIQPPSHTGAHVKPALFGVSAALLPVAVLTVTGETVASVGPHANAQH